MKDELTPETQKLILHWGEMGPRWGLSRSTAQIYALLFFTQQAYNAEQICETLSLARSNVSTSLKELLQDGVIFRESKLGERTDYFRSLDDVWETLQRIAARRKKTELDPSIVQMKTTVKEMDETGQQNSPARQKAAEMLRFLELAGTWSDEFQQYSPKSLATLSGMASQILKLIRGTIGLTSKPDEK